MQDEAVRDSVWVVESGVYVDPGPSVEGITGNPGELKMAWRLAELTLREDAAADPPSAAAVEEWNREAARVVERLRRR